MRTHDSHRADEPARVNRLLEVRAVREPTVEAKAKSPSKDSAAAKRMIASGATVIDVRTAAEYGEGHVATATNIPVDGFADHLADVAKLVGGDKSRPVVVYCAAGSRAARAKVVLEGAGYTNVVNGGGYDALK